MVITITTKLACDGCDNYARTGHKSDCVRQAAIAAAKAI